VLFRSRQLIIKGPSRFHLPFGASRLSNTDASMNAPACTDEDFLDTVEGQEALASKPMPSLSIPFLDSDRLEKCGRWLQSIPRADLVVLRQTSEFDDFLLAYERLVEAHRNLTICRSVIDVNHEFNGSSFQQWIMDDIVLRVFEYLECFSLIQASLTCSRFRDLSIQSATQRTVDTAKSRNLEHIMQLLRAQEEIDGTGNNMISDRPVRVPILGLRRRVLVTGAGDPDYNGIYHCTGSNGNGFVFTKPISCMTRVSANVRSLLDISPELLGEVDAQAAQQRLQDRVLNWDDEQVRRSGECLRCIITKRFSNETILWYMSKEIEETSFESTTRLPTSQVSQVYSFWATLMSTGEASSDLCQYPSQSSILSRNGDPAWQPLVLNRTIEPPVVELLDGA